MSWWLTISASDGVSRKVVSPNLVKRMYSLTPLAVAGVFYTTDCGTDRPIPRV